MKVFYINLDKDIDRRESMEKQLSQLGFDFERIPGVDGRNISLQEIDKVYNYQEALNKNGKDLTPAEIGCALSHKTAHQKALREDLTLVLEDDIILPYNFKEIIEEVTSNRTDFEYLQIDYPNPGAIYIILWWRAVFLNLKNKGYKKKFFYASKTLLYFIPVHILALYEYIRNSAYLSFKVYKKVNFYRPLYFAGCYIINKNGAKKLLELEEKIVFPADRLQNRARLNGLKHKALCPIVVRQDRQRFGSVITGESSLDY